MLFNVRLVFNVFIVMNFGSEDWIGSCGHKVTTIYSQCFAVVLPSLATSKIESISRSACWPTRVFMRNNLFTFATWLPLLFHHTHWDQIEELLCPSLGSGPILAQGFSALAPLLFGTTFHYLSIQPPPLPPWEDVSKRNFLIWPPPPPHRHRYAQQPVDVT